MLLLVTAGIFGSRDDEFELMQKTQWNCTCMVISECKQVTSGCMDGYSSLAQAAAHKQQCMAGTYRRSIFRNCHGVGSSFLKSFSGHESDRSVSNNTYNIEHLTDSLWPTCSFALWFHPAKSQKYSTYPRKIPLNSPLSGKSQPLPLDDDVAMMN